MSMIADGLLIFAAVAAAFYCWTLSKRLEKLKNADTGLSKRIAELNAGVEGAREAISEAKRSVELEQTRLMELVYEARLLKNALDSEKARVKRERRARVPIPDADDDFDTIFGRTGTDGEQLK